MSKVLVTGATGYIGNEVASGFRKEGFEVYGLTRHAQKAKLLLSQEILPLISSLKDLSLKKGEYEIIAHCAFENPEEEEKAAEKLLDSSPGKLLYTSGVWVYGNRQERVDESSLRKPLPHVLWRPGIEDLIFKSKIPTVIIRPGHVYGYAKGLFTSFFKEASEGKIELIEGGSNFWTQIHVSDLADLYVLAAKKGGEKEIFNGTLDRPIQLRKLAERVERIFPCKISSISLEKALQTIGPKAHGLCVDQREVSSQKAAHLLGWRPKHQEFIEEIDLYANLWKGLSS